MLLHYQPLRSDHCMTKTIDDGKEKLQIIKFYYFTKGRTDMVDQMNDYYTTRSKSCRWVMSALYS